MKNEEYLPEYLDTEYEYEDIYCSEKGKELLEKCQPVQLAEYLTDVKAPKGWFIVSDDFTWVLVLHVDDLVNKKGHILNNVLMLKHYDNRLPEEIKVKPELKYYYVENNDEAWNFREVDNPLR